MTNRQNHWFQSYSQLSLASDSPTERSGRPEGSEAVEIKIWQDIKEKLRLSNGHRVLEIGTGSGFIAVQWILERQKLNLSLTLIDFPKVIDRLCEECRDILGVSTEGVTFIDGVFPDELSNRLSGLQYDRISIYSVLHYSDDPRVMIDAAVLLLAPGGRLLVGDLPNLNKKGRFLATKFGRMVDAKYKNIEVSSKNIYQTHELFRREAIENGAACIDDVFVCELIADYRKLGFDVYVHEQPEGLLMNYSREDIIICAPYD